jgi:hypothetical protein
MRRYGKGATPCAFVHCQHIAVYRRRLRGSKRRAVVLLRRSLHGKGPE